jgi:tungstate transport system substrate-binding protein
MRLYKPISILLCLLLAAWLAACAPAQPTSQVLRLATTTSTADSGLLNAILPAFENQFNARVDVIAAGTGQALELGANGDVDVVLVHARAREMAFVEAGHGRGRLDVMYNDFILVGPAADPAGARGCATAAEALGRIAAAGAAFASRGDDSGTHSKELSLWAAAGLAPAADLPWYLSLGQGMGETLLFANERGAYTLTDRATWLAQKGGLSGLTIVFGGETISQNPDPGLYNPYGVIPVNPDEHPGVNFALATQFAEWLASLEGQRLIAEFGTQQYGQPLFYPDSAVWRANQ